MNRLLAAAFVWLVAATTAYAQVGVSQIGQYGSGLPQPVVNGECIIGSGGQAIWGSCSGSGTAVTSVTGGGAVSASPTTGAVILSTPNLSLGGVLTTGGAITYSGATSTTFDVSGGTITVPDATDTMALIAATQTFTNKIYNGGALSGTFTGGPTLSGTLLLTGNPQFSGNPVFSGVPQFTGLSTPTCVNALVLDSSNNLGLGPCGGSGGSSAFNALTSGTNTTAAMVVGTGATLGVSGSGTIAATSVPLSGLTGSQSANCVVASPNGSPGTVSCRSLVAADVPALSSLTGSVTATGMLALATGDWYVGNLSNQPSATAPSSAIDSAFGNTQGDLLCRGASTWSTLAPSSTINYVLTQSTLNACPTWQPAPIPTLTTTLETANFNGSSATVFYGINGSGITDTLSNPGTAVGAVYQGFSYDGANSYTLATTGGTADFYYGASSGATSITLPAGSSYNCVDSSTYYSCQITWGDVARQTVANTFSGTNGFTATSFPTAAAGKLMVGGATGNPTLAANGEAALYLDTTNGLDLMGQGSANDVVLRNRNGTIVAEIPSGSSGFQLGAALFINTITPINTNDKISITSGASPAGIEMRCTAAGTYCYNYLGNNTSATQFQWGVNGSTDTTDNCATANCAWINPGSGGLWLDASNIASGAGAGYLCASATTGWAQVETSTSCGAQTQTQSIGWTAGVNPTQSIVIADLPRAITLSSVVCRPEVAVGSTATVQVWISPSGTAIGGGGSTNVSSGSCNANGTAATNQSLTLTTTAVPAGDSIGIITTGTTDWTSGSGIGTISIYWTEQ